MDEKGITYEIDGKERTKDFIENHNNYFRTAAYRKNYIKYNEGEHKGQYIRLDFAYLKELSTIDMHLRFLILKMCLDIEHDLKVSLLTDITNNDAEDGYEIVKRFLNENTWVLEDIYYKRHSTYVGDLISKNFNFAINEETNKLDCDSTEINCPIWAFLKLISFGDFTKLYTSYYELYPKGKPLTNVINSVKSLRNACAHNNCLINDLKRSTATKAPKVITDFIKDIPGISKSERKANLSSRPLLEFASLLFLYSEVVSPQVKENRIKELSDLFNDRLIKHSAYFEKNEIIVSSYKFSKKLVDFLQN